MDRITRGKGDIFFLIITLAISLYCCSRAFYDHEGTREENYNAVLRLGFLLFFFWLGACYRKYGEKYLKRFINFKTSIVIFILQSMYVGLNGYVITTNVRNMRYNSINVPGGYWIPVVTAITGTLFFLGICYSLAPYFEKSRFLVTFGTNTKYVMYYHQLIFVLSSVLIAVLTKLEKLTLPGFNYDVMVNKQYYTGGNPTLTVVVALLAIILPVVVCSSINKLKPLWRYIIYAAITGVIVLFLYFAGRVLN